MSGFLLDTNCVSALVRIKPEPRVEEWMEATDEGLLYLSVLTLGEIRNGLAGLAQGKRESRDVGARVRNGPKSTSCAVPSSKHRWILYSPTCVAETTLIMLGVI